MLYKLSQHATNMIARRGLCPGDVAAALDGRRVVTGCGFVKRYDNSTHTLVLLDPQEQTIVTCYRATKSYVKRYLSR